MSSFMQPNVNIAYDLTVGVAPHTYWPTAMPVPGFVPHMEMVFPQLATVGYLMGANKFTTTVKHKQMPIVQDGHDQGILIPDLFVPGIVNFYYPLMWPFSKRKIMFSSSTVKFDGKKVGCSDITRALPMQTCGNPIDTVFCFPIFNVLNTLKTGLTVADFQMGVARIAVSLAISLLMNKLFPSSDPTGGWMKNFLKGLMGKMGLTPKSFFKRALSALAGFGFSLWEGNPTLKYSPVGGGPVPLKITVTPGNIKVTNGGAQLVHDRDTGTEASYPGLDDPLNIIPFID